ncbi:hypothetical protein BS17DRAFT_823495 [Gyrodon lividus]|nr:hypothetical protein BS17DRAFT_823495 [Gyrodon lividus]
METVPAAPTLSRAVGISIFGGVPAVAVAGTVETVDNSCSGDSGCGGDSFHLSPFSVPATATVPAVPSVPSVPSVPGKSGVNTAAGAIK